MFSKLILGVTQVLATENQRELAAAGGDVTVELKHFDMEYASDEGYKFHFANYGNDWAQVEGLSDDENKCGLDV